ncbi:MAG: hypothetical protein LVQ95_03910 [Candidatus Micrarchaeales archaeon]|nr:hypothetical protein [Candidatus Micrarchaeales archaeon]
MYIVYSLADPVSKAIADALRESFGFEEGGQFNGMRLFKCEKANLLELEETHLHADFLDELHTDLIIILSRHSSAKGVPSFTVHPMGNWNEEAKLGGKPKQLAVAAPIGMLNCLAAMKNRNKTQVPVTYEATHHGPLLMTPAFYAEIGGDERTKTSKEAARFLAESVFESLDIEAPYKKIAFGIGGLHYEDRFAKRALEGEYAFGHMISKHHVENVDMLQQAMERSLPRPDVAVIDWKSIAAQEREAVIKKLDELGMDYVKI